MESSERRDQLALRWILALVVLATGWCTYRLETINDSFTDKPEATVTYTMSYTDVDGQGQAASVKSQAGETLEHLALRFEEAVNVMQKLHPRR